MENESKVIFLGCLILGEVEETQTGFLTWKKSDLVSIPESQS